MTFYNRPFSPRILGNYTMALALHGYLTTGSYVLHIDRNGRWYSLEG